MRPRFQTVLNELNLLAELAEYEPTIIGTPPLGIDIESSDIDIACTTHDLELFKSDVTARFSTLQGLVVEHVTDFSDPAVRAAFLSQGWEIELFCQTLPIQEQHGVRHFHVEKRLLQIEPTLRSKVLHLKQAGQKTEPAFAALLRLQGDPYAAMLGLEAYSDRELSRLAAEGLSDAS
jgi:hypothetical protein